MNFRRIFIFVALCGMMTLVSCKKDKKEKLEYKNSFKGALEFALPEYVAPGEVITVVPTGLSKKDGKGIGYSWAIKDFGIKKEVAREENDPESKKGDFTFTVKDTVGTISIRCTASAEGYYSSTKYKEFIVVSPSKSLIKDDIVPNVESFTDSRDGKTYHYTTIGDTPWMIENLGYSGSGKSFKECKAMDEIFGKYYTWEEAQKACPSGWKLPSNEDWDNVGKALQGKIMSNAIKGIAGGMMVNAKFNDKKMWEFWPEVKITNASGFSAIPVGYVNISANKLSFLGTYEYASFWSADQVNEEQAYYRYINVKNPDLLLGAAHKNSFGASVRCVKINSK